MSSPRLIAGTRFNQPNLDEITHNNSKINHGTMNTYLDFLSSYMVAMAAVFGTLKLLIMFLEYESGEKFSRVRSVDDKDGLELMEDAQGRRMLELILIKVPRNQVDVLLQTLIACPPCDRNRWVYFLLRLWMHQENDDDDDTYEHGWSKLLQQIEIQHSQGGVAALSQLVQALLVLQDEQASSCSMPVVFTALNLMKQLKPQQVRDAMSAPHSAVSGFLRSICLCDSSTQAIDLVGKLHSLSKDRLRSVSLSFSMFPNGQVRNLMHAVMQADNKDQEEDAVSIGELVTS